MVILRRIGLGALALAACLVLGGTGRALAQTGNPNHDALSARSEAERRDLLRSTLQRNRAACSEVTVSYFAGLDGARAAYWDVACRNGGPFRITLAAERWAPPAVRACGASAPPPTSGPCFRPVMAEAGARPQAPAATPARLQADAALPSCRQACGSQPMALRLACEERCQAGGTVQAATPASRTGRRFGILYVAEPPSAAFGFANGFADRRSANDAAMRGCEAQAGASQCRLALDFTGACGALAHASGPGAQNVAIGQRAALPVRRLSTGTGATRAAAEDMALSACRSAEFGGTLCRIVASGC